MTTTRKERRRAELAARRVATKARLQAPPVPPEVPVALPWKRRATPMAARRRAAVGGEVWSSVVSGDARDLEGSLAAIGVFVHGLGPLLRGGAMRLTRQGVRAFGAPSARLRPSADAVYVARREGLDGWFKPLMELKMHDGRIIVLDITLTRSR